MNDFEPFYVKAIFDPESGTFVSDTNIKGLHVEAATAEEVLELCRLYAVSNINANHSDRIGHPVRFHRGDAMQVSVDNRTKDDTP